jgi:hypothetical protein
MDLGGRHSGVPLVFSCVANLILAGAVSAIVVDCKKKIKCTIWLQKLKKSFKILLTFKVGAIMFRQLFVIGLGRVHIIPGIFFAKFHQKGSDTNDLYNH